MTTATTRQQTIYPAISYRDAQAAIDWLSRVFGFEAHMVVPGEDGTIMHAEIRAGNDLFMMGTDRSDADPQTPAPVNKGFYVCVDDLDAAYQRVKDEGASILHELQDTDYGSREFSVHDVEGYAWTFGTYRPGTYEEE
ncbi:MAG: VOC family protein [Chloroflexota bacterium]